MKKKYHLYRDGVFVREIGENENYFAKDGESLRVSTFFMDASSALEPPREIPLQDDWSAAARRESARRRAAFDHQNLRQHADARQQLNARDAAFQRHSDGQITVAELQAELHRLAAVELAESERTKARFADQLSRRQPAAPPQQPALMHRPGFAILTDAQIGERMEAYKDHDARLASAWKAPAVLDPAALATSNGANVYDAYDQALENAWRSQNPECVPLDHSQTNAKSAPTPANADVYGRHEAALREAWRMA